MRTLKLGTRKSHLAWAQSSWVAREVEAANPGVRVELVGIETQGDRIQDIPLSKIEGKEFFVAELDHALRAGSVDFTVHSLKDLSLERPKDFIQAAVPKRAPAHDVVIYRSDIVERIRSGAKVRIGSSAPRRKSNLPRFLMHALPNFGAPVSVEMVDLRGNVPTRLQRVGELDGVVLALAGLERLWRDPVGRAQVEPLVRGRGCRIQVLPLSVCAAAPGQGALSIECLRARADVQEALGKLHDPETWELVQLEREVLREWGGGCHQPLGASAFMHPSAGRWIEVAGEREGAEVREIRWLDRPARPSGVVVAWDGILERKSESLPADPVTVAGATLVSHSRVSLGSTSAARLWAAGVESWKSLAQRGHFIEGCLDRLGKTRFRGFLKESQFLGLPETLEEWTVLSHRAPNGQVSAYPYGEAGKVRGSETHFFWGSATQYEALCSELPGSAIHHACGLGETFERLTAEGVNAQAFVSVEEWRKWVGINP